MNKLITLGFIALISFLSQASMAQTPPLKEWTFLVYMNSDNNLWRFGQMNMAEMERIGSTDQVNIVVEQDPEPSGMPTTRYYVTKNPNAQPGKVTSKVVGQAGETDMGDPKHLAEFVAWGIKNFPAKHYALVMWNHGAGWRGASFDENPNSTLTVPEMAQALKAVGKSFGARGPILDLINFDECLMSTLEVAFELKDVAKTMVGSQFNEPGEGEDYTTFLGPLVQKPTMSAAELASTMVYQYTLRYAKKNASINYLAVDLTKIPSFTGAFSKVADGHLTATADIQRALKSTYSNNDFEGDLIGGMQGARKTATKSTTLATSIDELISMYGYPAKNETEMARGINGAPAKAYYVMRYSPGVVHYRYGANQAWSKLPLAAYGDGSYRALIPAAPAGGTMQYVFVRSPRLEGGAPAPEASSIIMREGSDPIVFHNKFPENSPVIADAYNHQTKGAHGMTLYFFSSVQMKKQNRGLSTSELLTQYMELAFAKIGAPSWTKFFGL